MTKNQFKERLKRLNITIREFSNISNTSYSTINNWGFKQDEKIIPLPGWVEPFLEHYEKSRKYDYLKDEIFDIIKDLEK